MQLQIVRKKYSSNPWRLVQISPEGTEQEIWIPKEFHHVHLGNTSIATPVAGHTRKACEREVLKMLSKFLEQATTKETLP